MIEKKGLRIEKDESQGVRLSAIAFAFIATQTTVMAALMIATTAAVNAAKSTSIFTVVATAAITITVAFFLSILTSTRFVNATPARLTARKLRESRVEDESASSHSRRSHDVLRSPSVSFSNVIEVAAAEPKWVYVMREVLQSLNACVAVSNLKTRGDAAALLPLRLSTAVRKPALKTRQLPYRRLTAIQLEAVRLSVVVALQAAIPEAEASGYPDAALDNPLYDGEGATARHESMKTLCSLTV